MTGQHSIRSQHLICAAKIGILCVFTKPELKQTSMEPYSPIDKPLSPETGSNEKPAPYNWLLLLMIFIGYIVFAVLS
jgi:hypothetical protein